MRLSDWTINLDSSTAGDGAAASITCATGRKVATVSLGRGWFDYSPEEKRHTLVHELVHIHFTGLMITCQNVSGTIGTSAYEVYYKGVLDQLEYGVDAIAEILSPGMPMPEGL